MATFTLPSTMTSTLTLSHYVLRPGVTYSSTTAGGSSLTSTSTTKSVSLDNIYVCAAIARGLIVFNDGTNVITFLQDPAVAAYAKQGHLKTGFLGTWNIYALP